MGDFKGLNLNQSELRKCVVTFCQQNNILDLNYTELRTGLIRLRYTYEGKPVLIDIYLNQNGTSTIQPKTGPNPELGVLMAEHIKKTITIDERKNIAITVRDISSDTFDLLREYFSSQKIDSKFEYNVLMLNPEKNTDTIKITNIKYNDTLTVVFYKTTNTLLIQGRPLYTYYQMCYFLSEYLELNGYLSIINKVEENTAVIKISQADVDIQLKALLPSAYEYIDATLRKMLKTSLTFKFVDIELDDYTCFVFPALRALEGVIRKILFDNEIKIEEHDNKFKDIFILNKDGKYELHDDMKLQLDPKINQALSPCYNYFIMHRHTLFHTNDFTESSRIIQSKNQAYALIDKILELVDNCYYTISK